MTIFLLFAFHSVFSNQDFEHDSGNGQFLIELILDDDILNELEIDKTQIQKLNDQYNDYLANCNQLTRDLSELEHELKIRKEPDAGKIVATTQSGALERLFYEDVAGIKSILTLKQVQRLFQITVWRKFRNQLKVRSRNQMLALSAPECLRAIQVQRETVKPVLEKISLNYDSMIKVQNDEAKQFVSSQFDPALVDWIRNAPEDSELNTPLVSIDAIQYLANRFRRINAKKASGLLKIQQEFSARVWKNESGKIVPAYDDEREYQRLQKNFMEEKHSELVDLLGQDDLTRFGREYLDACLKRVESTGFVSHEMANYFQLTEAEREKIQNSIYMHLREFNDRHATFQLESFADYRNQLSTNSLEILDELLGPPPKYLLRFYDSVPDVPQGTDADE